MPNHLELIVKNMVAAEEPEENIKAVVEEHNATNGSSIEKKECDEGFVWDDKQGACVAISKNEKKKASVDFLDQPIIDEVEPLITKEEFSIFKGDDKEEAEDKVSKLINTKLASKNITAKPALNLSDGIEVTLANGVSIEIPLYTERNTTGTLTRDVDPDQPYEDLMNFISQPIDQKQADIYSKTKLKANEDGSYDVGIQQDYGLGGDKLVLNPASSDQILQITEFTENEINRAFTSVSVDGLDIEYPGLEGQYNSFNLQNIPEDTREEVKKAVYEQVAKRFREADGSGRRNLTYDQFLKVIGGPTSGLLTKTLNNLATKQQQKNNRKALNGVEVNKEFIKEQNKSIFEVLTKKEKIKVGLVSSLSEKRERLKAAKEEKDQGAIDMYTNDINKILGDIKINATTKGVSSDVSLVTGQSTQDDIDEKLASSFMNELGMTDYRAQNAARAAGDVKDDSILPTLLQSIKHANPTLTDKEALIKYYEAKTVRYQQLMKEGDELTISLDISKTIENESYKKEFYALMEQMKKSSGKASLFSHEGYSEGKIKIPLNDIFNAGLDARDFNGLFDVMEGMISEKDLDLLNQYEATRDENMGERRGLYELIYLNTNPESMEGEGGIASFLRQGSEAIMTQWLGTTSRNAKLFLGGGDLTDRAVKDYVQSTLGDYNSEFAGKIDPFTGAEFQPIQLTEDQIEKLTRTFSEEVGEGVGDFTPMLIEMAGINIATGGILSYGQVGRVYQMFRTGSKFQKLAYHGFNLAVEEVKMQQIFDMPVTGGAVFYLGGQATSGIKPFKNKFAWLNPLYQKVVQGGVVGASSAQSAKITKAWYDSFMGEADFASEFNDMYGEMSDWKKHMLVEMMVFSITGFSHVKKTDLMTSSRKIDLMQELGKENQKMLNDAAPKIEGVTVGLQDVYANPEKYLTAKQLKKYQQNIEFGQQLDAAYKIDRQHFDFDPSNPNFEKNLREQKLDVINQQLREELGESFVPIKLKLSSKREDYAHENGKDLGNIAQFKASTNTITVDPKSFKVGSEKWNHEITHAILHAHFKNKPQAKEVFLQKMKANLKQLDLKVADGTPLAEAIEGVYKKDVTLEEFTAYAVEILSNKEMYSQEVAPNIFSKIKQNIVGIMTEYGYTPKIKTAQHAIDALGRFAQNPSNKKFNVLKNADMPSVEAKAENVKVVKESTFGSRDLNQKKISLDVQKEKLIAENKRLAAEKPEGYKELMKKNSTKLTEKGGINEQIKVNEGNIKNNEVNKEHIPVYKKLLAEKQAQLEKGGRLYEKTQELARLKKEFPNGSSEIAKLEQEILENKLPPGKQEAFTRANNELYKNNKKLVNEFIGKSYESGGELTYDQFMSATRLIVAQYMQRYDPAKNDTFGIYLRQSLFGKDYNYKPIGTDARGNPIYNKPLQYGNVIKLADPGGRISIESKTGEKVSFTGTDVLENMADVTTPEGTASYVQGENYSIGEGKLAKDLLKLDKNPATEGILKEIRSNVTDKGVMINGKEILTKDLTYNDLINLAPKGSGKNLFGKNYKAKAEYLKENWNEILQILPKNLNTITGEAGIVETVLLDAHYKSAADSKRINIEQGNVEGVGNVLRELRPQTIDQFLAEYKLKIDENGKLDLSGLDVKGKSPAEVLEIRAVIRKMGLLEGKILQTITNQEIRQEIANKVKNGDHELGKKVGIQTVMNQIRSGKNDIMASRLDVINSELTNIEKFLLDQKVISPIIIAQALEQSNLSAAEKKILGGRLFEVATRYDTKSELTGEVVKKGLEGAKEQEMREVEIKEMEYVDQGKYDKLTDYFNKKYPKLKLTKDVYGKLGEKTITIEEMRVIDAKLIAMFPEGMPKELNSATLEQFGIGQSRKINGERINRTKDENGKTSFDLTVQSLTGGPRGNNGKKYQGEYDAVNISDPGIFKTKLREFRKNYKGKDLNGDLYDFAREYLTKKGVHADNALNRELERVGEKYTFEDTVAANEKLRSDYMTNIYEMVRKTPEAELGKTIQGILRHFQMQTDHGTGISKGTFSFTAISNILSEPVMGKNGKIISSTGYHAEHKLQIANYHANVVDAMLRNRNNPEGFKKELELLNRDAQQTVTQFADKLKYDDPSHGGTSGNIDPATGKPSYNVSKIAADITYLIERPGMASEIVDLTGSRGSTLADKIFLNATKKDITQALSEIKKETWSADVYTLEFKNNNRKKIQEKAQNKIEFETNNEVNNEIILASRLNLNTEFNSQMQGNYGIGKEKTYSPAKAEMISNNRAWYKKASELFVGSNADDFKGLTNYRLVNQKGKKGEAQQKFYDDNLHIPYAMGVNALNVAKNQIQTEYKNLNKQFPNVKKILEKDIPGEIFSNANAARVYLWTKNGIDMTEFGLSKKDIKKLNDAVTSNPELQAYADQIGLISGQKGGYVQPDAFWLTQGIQHDLASLTTGKGRENFLSEFNGNVDVIFSKENLNKLQVIHGKEYRESLENSIYRMKKGTNRVFSQEDKLMNNFSDWVNGSVGVTMFLNTRSGVLQTLSATNYIDWGANNPINAAKAFANPRRYWEDFGTIFNSPMMKQRRGGLQTDVNHTELAAMAKKGGAKGVIGSLLTKGFVITKLADSFAIANGGAAFYRNYINKYIKEGLSVKAAEAKAWEKFNERTQTTQQSSDPSKVSQLQSSGLGRLVFAFQNTPMQYTREIKKSALDLAYGRGDTKHNISKILYYGAAQSFIFGALQNAMFTAVFDDDEQKFDTKTARTLNNMFDTILRGSGLPGAVLATTKNVFMKFAEEEKKGFNADHAQTLIQAANFAPPIGIKARKLYSSMRGYQLNKDVIPHMGYSINNPAYQIAGNLVSGATNFPLDRIVQKSYNINEIITGDHQWWQNTSLAAGYRPWDVGIEDAEKEEAKGIVAQEKKIEKIRKRKIKDEENKIENEKILLEEGEKKQELEKKENKPITCLKCKRPVLEGKKLCTVHVEVKQRKDGKKVRCTLKYPKGHAKAGEQCGEMTANKSGLCYYHD